MDDFTCSFVLCCASWTSEYDELLTRGYSTSRKPGFAGFYAAASARLNPSLLMYTIWLLLYDD